MKSLQYFINEQVEQSTTASETVQDTGIEKGQRKDVDEKTARKEKLLDEKTKEENEED